MNIYSKLLNFILQIINTSIQIEEMDDCYEMNILDVFGFENLLNTNSFCNNNF